ncbi:MAG TPA: GatB/YqeY domain-containing protein [Propionibacteriaceae bacterium]|nr:GatB/YqeY domain-containing protein [Propionibacteriaceae bacterium]
MGTLKDQLRADLVIAMKAKDDAAKSNLRMVLAAIGNEEVAGASARELSDAEELAVVTREVNKRRDSAQAYAAGNRPELAAKETSEAEFLAAYLPTRLTPDELKALVDAEVAAAAAGGDAPTMKQMGVIIKAVGAKAAGRADGGSIAALVRAALA